MPDTQEYPSYRVPPFGEIGSQLFPGAVEAGGEVVGLHTEGLGQPRHRVAVVVAQDEEIALLGGEGREEIRQQGGQLGIVLLAGGEDLGDLIAEQHAAGIITKYEYEPATVWPWWVSLLPYVGMIILFAVLWFFMMGQIGGKNGKPGGFAKARVKTPADTKQKVLFSDVAGADEEKAELEEALSSGTLPFDRLQEASERIGQIIAETDEKEMRWLELSE